MVLSVSNLKMSTSLPNGQSSKRPMLTTKSMTVTFDKSVAPSLLEGGYNYTPSGNNTIQVYFGYDQDRDIYDILAEAGLEHVADSVIYTDYFNEDN